MVAFVSTFIHREEIDSGVSVLNRRSTDVILLLLWVLRQWSVVSIVSVVSIGTMAASSRSQAISLYKMLLRESGKFPSYNYRWAFRVLAHSG